MAVDDDCTLREEEVVTVLLEYDYDRHHKELISRGSRMDNVFLTGILLQQVAILFFFFPESERNT